MELVVPIQIFQVVIDHDEHFTARLGYPVEAAIDADDLRIVVVLQKIDP